MSYYRYITGIYKSYWPELNRTLRSSSSPRHIPEPVPHRIARATSQPPSEFYSNSYFAGRVTARPFNERSLSMPRQISYSYDDRCVVSPPRETSVPRTSSSSSHYTDFDYKVINYMGKLAMEDTVKTSVSRARVESKARSLSHPLGESYSEKYNYYDTSKHESNYLYDSTKEVLGTWKHYNLSGETLRLRNLRSKSPLVTRELDRYFEMKPTYVGDRSSGTCDFRHYNYRRVPYFGGSDDYNYMRRRPLQFSRAI